MKHGLPEPSDVVAGKYTVERELGRGGMGAVYEVSHRLTGKRLALKCLLPDFADNPSLVERFVREAQATGRIQHRSVVNVFDVGRDGSLMYLVMELLDGKPLSELLHDETLTLEEALAIVVRAMEGVAAAHAMGIVHRDLKPDNIFVCRGPSGRLDDPRVLDFGISKLDDGDGMRLTRSGVAMGTPYYMALEQLSGRSDLDVRVDVYAMGVVLYEAIAGTPPHTADSVSALAIRVLTTQPVPLETLREDLPAGLSAVIMKAIAKQREDRYPTMQALIDAVRPYVPQGAGLLLPEGQGKPLRTPRSATPPVGAQVATLERSDTALAPLASTPPQVPSQHAPGPTPTPVRWAAVGALLVVLAVGGIVLGLRAARSPAPQTTGTPAASTLDTTAVGAPSTVAAPPQAAQPQLPATPEADAGATTTLHPQTQEVGATGSDQAAAAPSSDGELRTGKRGRGRGKKHADGDSAAEGSPSNATTPAAPGTADKAPTKAQGRAGQLGADEF